MASPRKITFPHDTKLWFHFESGKGKVWSEGWRGNKFEYEIDGMTAFAGKDMEATVFGFNYSIKRLSLLAERVTPFDTSASFPKFPSGRGIEVIQVDLTFGVFRNKSRLGNKNRVSDRKIIRMIGRLMNYTNAVN